MRIGNFLFHPNLRYSKHRASTVTAAPHPVWRTQPPAQWHCHFQPHSSNFSSSTLRCGYTQVLLPASSGLRRQRLMCGHGPHLRKEERRFGYHFSSFLHTKGTSACAVRSTQPVTVTRLLQCRGLSDGTKEVCCSVPQTHSAVKRYTSIWVHEFITKP